MAPPSGQGRGQLHRQQHGFTPCLPFLPTSEIILRHHAYHHLERLEEATAGVRPVTVRQLIDHVALSRHFTVESVHDWDGRVEGRKLSDHSGVLIDLRAAP